MKILAIETSSDILSICVSENELILGEYTIKNPNTHSPKILPMIDTLLNELSFDITDIDTFACSIGPGSFTGLRIGVSVAKSFAQANSKNIIGIPTLHSLAKNIQVTNELICPIIDAKNDNIYTCIFDSQYNLILDYSALTISEICEICEKQNMKINFIGDGAIKYKSLLQNLHISSSIISDYLAYPTAKTVALIANEYATKDSYSDIFNLSPMYLKPSQAERLHKNE